MSAAQPQRPYLGFGLGLRPEHYQAVVDEAPRVDWFEIISENYMVPGGKPLAWLDRIRANYPLVMHGVSLSIGSVDALDETYLDQLARLAERVEPQWVSDHLCWTGVDQLNMHDLLPLPYTEEALAHVARRIEQVQERLRRPFLIENVSSYISYADSRMSEWEFLVALAERADCRILLDINNIHVSARNHGFNAHDYVDAIPAERVYQIHLAGHQDNTRHIIDTHDQPVTDAVWALYAHALRRLGNVSTMIERDADIPPLPELVEELERARTVAASATAPVASSAP